MDRNKKISRTSFIGIAVNVMLAALKMVFGLIANSIAIILDAVNNMSDALSSVITVIGAKISGRKPDKKHPFGMGRIEYITASIISVIVLYVGVTALVESVKQMFAPEIPDYSVITLIFVAAAVVVKFLLGRYFIRTGKAIQSNSLIASGREAELDSAVSLSTLIAALVFVIWGVGIEAYLGAIIAVLMIRSGLTILFETISQILGERPDSEKTKAVKETALSFKEVSGVYDVVLHNYGPDYLIGSFHIEIPGDMRASDIDKLQREIAEKVYEECGVIVAGISIYGSSDNNDKANSVQNGIRKIVMSNEYILQIHGFSLDEETKTVRFDVVVDFKAPDRESLYREIMEKCQELYPEYSYKITLDEDISD